MTCPLRVSVVVAGALACAAAPRPAEPAGEPAARAVLFDYEKAASLGMVDVGSARRDGVTIRDLTFAARPGDQEPTRAYLVVPDGPGPFAGVLWVHWLGDPETTNRTQYLEEAEGLAAKGVVSLLVDAMWSEKGWYGKRVLAEDRQRSIRQVIAIRRAMDLLASQPGVDKARLGFVGHDYGAMYGMIAAGVDARAKTYVYVAPTQSLFDWAFFANQPASKADYIRENADLELTDFLHQVKNASTLFQFASGDVYVSRADTGVLLSAASAPKERRFYEAEHSMIPPTVAADRDAWLLKELVAGGAPTP